MIINGYPEELNYVNAQLHPLARGEDNTSFLSTFCRACLCADSENYEMLRPILFTLMLKYPADPNRLMVEKEENE